MDFVGLISRTVTVVFVLTGSVWFAVSEAAPVVGDDIIVERPKIGLVLSGGGARGAAHIGVIQVLEDHRIPIDYISGTSMGSIIGGLYAIGMNTDELIEAVNSVDWDAVFLDSTPRDERSFRRKRDDDLYFIKAKPGIDRTGLKFPAGVVQGQKIDLVLARLTRNVSHIDDFDDFAIPFRAVATDISTGDAVVLESGNLAMAIRASMSIPAVMAPITIDGKRLVDGGVANNLPIDVVRAMGADIVIAIDISTPLNHDQLDSVIAITEQLSGILTRRTTEHQISTITSNDILIVPDIGDITTADFDHVNAAIPIGRAAAEDKAYRFQHLALSSENYMAHQAARNRTTMATPVIDFIRIDNRSRLKNSAIASRIIHTQVGQPLDVTAIERDIGLIYGLEIFQNVRYELVNESGKTGLLFHVEDRSWGPAYLQLGASYNSNGDGDNIFNVAVSYLHTAINPSGGELRLGVQIGEEPGVRADFHQPFGRDNRFFANGIVGYGESLLTVFDGNSALAEIGISEVQAEFSVGREFGTWGEGRIGIRYADGDAKVKVGDPLSFPKIQFERGEVFTRLFADKLDSAFFPRSGYLATAEWTGSRDVFGADTDFDQVTFSGLFAKTWGENTLLGDVDFGITTSGIAPIQSVFRRGGFTNLSGFNENELSGQHFGQISAIYYRKFGHLRLLPLYAGLTIEAGNVWQNRSDIEFENTVLAGSVFVGSETPLGPLYLAYGLAEGGKDAYYVFLGRPF